MNINPIRSTADHHAALRQIEGLIHERNPPAYFADDTAPTCRAWHSCYGSDQVSQTGRPACLVLG